MNQEEKYPDYVQTILSVFETAQASGEFSIDYNRIQRYENFTQIFLMNTLDNERIELKIDLVNDVAMH